MKKNPPKRRIFFGGRCKTNYFCLNPNQHQLKQIRKLNWLYLMLVCSIIFTYKESRADELRSFTDDPTALRELKRVKKALPKNLDSALMLLQQMEPHLLEYNNKVKAVFFNTYGLYYWYTRDHETSIQQFKRTLALVQDSSIIDFQAEAANNAGSLFSSLGMQDSSIAYLEVALKIDEARGFHEGLAKTYYDIGSTYKRKGQYELALRYMLQSRDINEQIGDKPQRIIGNYNVLGILYQNTGDTAASLASYRKAVDLALKNADSSNLCMLYGNISALYMNAGESGKGLSFALKSRQLMPSTANLGTHCVVLINIAGAYSLMNQLDSATYYFRKAKPLFNALSIGHQAEAFIDYADLLLKVRMPDSAEYYINQGYEIAQRIQSPMTLADCYGAFYKLDSLRGNYKSALTFFHKQSHIRDSILDFEHKARVAELRIIHESDRKQQENQALKDQNVLKESMIFFQQLGLIATGILLVLLVFFLLKYIKSNRKIAEQQAIILQKNDELLQLNQTKDKFLSIIAHDLRSPFNALLGLLQDLIENNANYTEEEKMLLLQKTYQSSNNTFNLLVNLLDWAMAQRNGLKNNPSLVEVDEVVKRVFQVLESRASQKHISLQPHVDSGLQVWVDPNILTNILINLVNNAIKFTPDDGAIRVSGRNLADEVLICVEDNGIGIPANQLDQLFKLDSDFRRQGTSGEQGTGLGLILVKEFVNVCGGKINVESEQGKGSRFCLTLPASQNN